MSKITDLIKSAKQLSHSIEVTPEVDRANLDNLKEKPLFICVTWHARKYDFKSFDIAPVTLARHLKSKGNNVCLHLSCDLLKKDYANGLLKSLRDSGICNLVVLLGESYDSKGTDFKSSQELIQFIRNETCEYFCIGIAGFLDCTENAFKKLKNKINAGADFILTEGVVEATRYKTFLDTCVSNGITVPILPGVFFCETQKELIDVTNEYGIKVSEQVLKATKKSVIDFEKNMYREIVKYESGFNHIHFFTRNKIGPVINIVKQL